MRDFFRDTAPLWVIMIAVALLFGVIYVFSIADAQHQLDMIRTCHEAGGYMIIENTCVFDPIKP